MKLKKLFALSLAVCMMVSVMPTSFAGNGFLSLDGVQPAATPATTGPSLTLDTPGTASGGSVTTPSLSQSSQSVYTPYVYSNPYGVSSVAEEGDGEGETTPAAPKATNTEVLSEGSSASVQSSFNTSWTGNGTGLPGDVVEQVTNDKVGTAKSIVTVDGKAYLQLEAYVTGASTTSTVETIAPMDIVLVLDQSGSMTKDFGNTTRQAAMKTAVKGFIDTLSGHDTGEVCHRMSIVTYGTSASILNKATDAETGAVQAVWSDSGVWFDIYTDPETQVNAGATFLKNAVDNLPAPTIDQSTNVSAGMTKAAGIMASGGVNNRQKVVIVFTDGVPTAETTNDGNSVFSTTVADTAISTAKALKDGGCTIYTIGIFGGAEPSETYGDAWVTLIGRKDCTGEKGTHWGSSGLSNLINALLGNDFADIDIAAGNRFLNYLSSNYEDVTEIGLARGEYNRNQVGTYFIGTGTGYEITTEKVSADASGYYQKATDASSLNDIFDEISGESTTGGASINLGSGTVVKDVLSTYFKLPDGIKTSDILVYTSAYTGKNVSSIATSDWGALSAPPRGITVNISEKTVEVSGFDFATNYVGTNNNTSTGSVTSHGQKLVIQIPFEAEPDFLGGHNVVTNGEGSGVWGVDAETGARSIAETFVSPTTKVNVRPITVTAENKNIYLSHELSVDEMLVDAEIKIGNSTLNLSEKGFGLDAWKVAYLTSIQVTATNNNDGTFTVSCDATSTDSTNKSSGNGSANIKVFKPHITFNDSTIYLGEWANYADDPNDSYVAWCNGNTLSTDVSMIGDEPSVTVTYDLATGYFDGCEDISVETVKLNNSGNYAADTIFWNGETKTNNSHQFTVHVVKPTIQYADTTIYLGDTVTFIDQVAEADMWECDSSCEARRSLAVMKNETERLAPTIHYDYGDASTQPGGCTEVTVTATIGTGANKKTVTAVNNDPGFWIHVLQPTVTFQDSEIFLSEKADYATDNVVLTADGKQATWDCQCVENKGSTTEDPPELTYTYQPEEGFFETCQPVDVTVFAKFTSDVNITSGVTFKNGSEDRTASEEKFKVHVYRPNIVLTSQPLWNNYDATADYEELAQGVATVAIDKWTDQCGAKAEKSKDSTEIALSAPQYTFKRGETDIAEYMAKTYDTTDKDTITATLTEIKVGAGTYDVAKQLPAVAPVNFDIHVNKFELTINTDWTNPDGEEQGSIFTVTPVDREDENLKPITVAIPKGESSVVINGLFSGQEYTIAEDNGWTWRYGTAAEAKEGASIICYEEFDTDEPDKEAEVTMSFDSSKGYNPKWLADEDCVINKATTQATTINPTLSVKKKDEEVTNA